MDTHENHPTYQLTEDIETMGFNAESILESLLKQYSWLDQEIENGNVIADLDGIHVFDPFITISGSEKHFRNPSGYFEIWTW